MCGRPLNTAHSKNFLFRFLSANSAPTIVEEPFAVRSRLYLCVEKFKRALIKRDRSLRKKNKSDVEFGYPRPQMVRAGWRSLNGMWDFAFDDQLKYVTPQEVEHWTHQIRVPFAPESQASSIGDTGFHRACWYQREFEILKENFHVILHFGAVDYRARVWVNGVFVTEHEGGHTPFSVDITHTLRDNGRQKVSVWVEDDPHDLEKPRGKQDWLREPHSIWYPRTTGIWQTVWIERVAEMYICRIRWTPHVERWEIGFEAFIGGELKNFTRIALYLHRGDQILLHDIYEVISGEVHRRIALSDPGIDDYRNDLLWSPERPTLISANIKLWCGETLMDEVDSYTALRSTHVQRDRFMLNGRPYPLRMVLDQGYWPESLMTAPNDQALCNDVRLAKAMGFNGVRKHQKIEDPRYLYWADHLGLLVWEEMPSAYRFSSRSICRLTREWTEVIERDYSHPCIIMWVPFNESWGVPDLPQTSTHRDAVQAFYHLTKTLDPTRPVIGNDGWESTATDVIGIHDYDCNPSTLRERYGPFVKPEELFDRRRPGGRILTLDGYPHRGQPIILSEFGGIAFSHRDTGDTVSWGYIKIKDRAEFTETFAALMEVVRTTAMFSGFCYTQFTDTFQEANGLLYADRTPKLPIKTIARTTRGQ